MLILLKIKDYFEQQNSIRRWYVLQVSAFRLSLKLWILGLSLMCKINAALLITFSCQYVPLN